MTLVSVGEISANQIAANVVSEELSITGVRDLSVTTRAGDTIRILGKNFGTEAKDTKVFLNGQTYPVEGSFGNEVLFKLDKKMRSGEVFVERTMNLPSGISKRLTVNSLTLNLGEPSLTKIDAPGGLLPGADLKVEGTNLAGASFFCSEKDGATALKVREQSTKSARLELPNQFTDCTLTVRNHGFEFIVSQKFQISAPISMTGLDFSNGGFRVFGKNFSIYENKLDQLALIFEDGKLNQATLLADGTLFFAKDTSKILPNSGFATLAVGDKNSPRFEYRIAENFPRITKISDLRDAGDGKTSFQIETSGEPSELATTKLFLNGTAVTFGASTATLTGRPKLNGEAWLEKDGWRSEIFNYAFTENLEPAITEIRVNTATRSLEIHGRNFGSNRDKFKVSGVQFKDPSIKTKTVSTDDKSWLKKVEELDAITELPFSTGNPSVSVSNRWGTSNSVKITLPLKTSQSFFPDFTISSIESITGFAPGRRIVVHGTNLLGATFANISGQQISTKVLALDSAELTVPADAPLKGEIFLSDKNGKQSNKIPYELITTNQVDDPMLKFPLSPGDGALVQNNEWQNLFDFELSNTLKTVTIDSLEFNFDKTPLPLIDFRVVDAKNAVVAGARVDLAQTDKKLRIRNLTIPTSLAKTQFTLQAKVFSELAENGQFIFSLGNVSEKSGQQINSVDAQKKITIAGNLSTERFCTTLIDAKSGKCKVQRPVSDLARKN